MKYFICLSLMLSSFLSAMPGPNYRATFASDNTAEVRYLTEAGCNGNDMTKIRELKEVDFDSWEGDIFFGAITEIGEHCVWRRFLKLDLTKTCLEAVSKQYNSLKDSKDL